ncbi:MAG: heparinase II/III family protein [Myxococcales bacterium]|nr:heparinase II/III family protein [Myxococcales bacterium]
MAGLLAFAASGLLTGCPPSTPPITVLAPNYGDEVGATATLRVGFNGDANLATFQATLNGTDITAGFTINGLEATAASQAVGRYWNLLDVSVQVGATVHTAETAFHYAPAGGGWYPEVTTYPRLVYRAADFPTIQDRLTRQPYQTLYARIVARANQNPGPGTPGVYVPSEEYPKANVAKAAAFSYAVDGTPAHGAKARDLLLTMKTDYTRIDPLDLGSDVHAATAILAWVGAYDILAGTGLLTPTEDATIRANLGTLVDGFYHTYVEVFPILLSGWQNNHNTMDAAAVGAAAIVLNDHPRAEAWASFGRTEVDYQLRHLIASEGGYAEGPHYWVYSAQIHVPFLWAMHDYLAAVGAPAGLPHRVNCAVRALVPPCAAEVLTVPDTLLEAFHRGPFEWAFLTRTPGGSRPPYDDSWLEPNVSGLVASLYGDSDLAWDWAVNDEYPYSSNVTGHFDVDLIARYDDAAVTPQAPTRSPTAFLPESGNAIFRDGWGSDAVYMLVLGEHGAMRNSGHEHTDATSFSIYKAGEWLALDPGYIQYDYRDLVYAATNHNMLLVDGAGPPSPSLGVTGGTDAYIEHGMDTAFTDYVEARADYTNLNAHVRRRVVFENESFFILADEVTADQMRTFTWQLHGHGGGDTGGDFALIPGGAEWQRPTGAPVAKLRAHVTSDLGPPTLHHELDNQGLTYLNLRQHETLRADVTGTAATFLSVLLAEDAADPYPAVTELADGVFKVADGTDTVVAGLGTVGTPLFVDGAASVVGTVEAAGRLAVARADTATGDLAHATLSGGTSLSYDGAPVVTLDVAANVTVRFGPATIDGAVSGDATQIMLPLGSAPSAVAGAAVTGYAYGAGTLTIDVSGPTDFAVTP